MIIVEQDKEMIVNFDNISVVYIDNEKTNRKILATNNTDTIILGEYATNERAKEVLQEIISKYSKYLKLEGGPAILQGQMDIQPNIFHIPKVYEMPTE